MNLLDKFDAVEVKADRRISPVDKSFCEAQEAACIAASEKLKLIADMIKDGLDEQDRLLNAFSNCASYFASSNLDDDKVLHVRNERHERMVRTIVHYFERKYNVSLNAGSIIDHLVPKEPEHPYSGFYTKPTEEERTQYKASRAAYQDQMDQLVIHYQDIVDEIFQQLGGFSFAERSLREMKKDLWNKFHYKGWHSDGKLVENFEIKGQTLKLTSYAVSYDEWFASSGPWQMSDSTKALLDAIAHYEIGDTNAGVRIFPSLMDYRHDCSEYNPCMSEKVEKIKCYKNGKVDIKFKDAATCNDFVDRYLRTEITEV